MAFSLESFSLEGKVAIVTGAGARARSIGESYATGLGRAGARVVVADIDGTGAEAVAKSLQQQGIDAMGVETDIASRASTQALAATARDAFGGVDILVNNAALMVEITAGGGSRVIDCSDELWARAMDVNLTGALLCSQAVAPLMRERGGGKIVNQVSAGAYPATSLYGITKLALVGLTTTLAQELGPDKINVNAIAPGMTQSAAGASLTPPESPLRQMLDAQIALRPLGEPEDLVGTLLLLCSTAGDWITGQVLHVDGGWVIRP